MIIIEPVIETYAAGEFTAWPVAGQAFGPLLGLSGDLGPAGVGTVMAVIASYGEDAPGSAPALIERVIAADCLIAPGGLRVHDSLTGATVDPGCCCGLEDWRDWQDVPGGKSPWLGHDPAPWIEHAGSSIRLWPDGGLGRAPAGGVPVEIPLAGLPALIDAVGLRLRGFLGLVEPWAAAMGLPGGRELAAALDRHFRITNPVLPASGPVRRSPGHPQ